MKVFAIGETGADLNSETLGRSGNTARSRFNLTKRATYVAYSMALSVKGLISMLLDDTGKPNWKMSELFNVLDSRIPHGWEFIKTTVNPRGADRGTLGVFGDGE